MALSAIPTFEVERWMDDYQPSAKYDIGETCAASISIDELKDLSEDKNSNPLQLSRKMTYGDIRGSDKLRSNLANLYSARSPSPLPMDNVMIMPGAIAANFCLFYSLLRKGDHVICHYPTYQQLYSAPATLGVEVTLWKTDQEKNWQLDLQALRVMIRPETRMIIINNPNNPTGVVLGRSFLVELIEIAREHDLILFSDEVYRPLFHGISPMNANFPPSILSMGYEKAIATGSMSKAYALAGIRVGWIASRSREIIDACAHARDYTNISVSQLDDQIASFATSPDCIHSLLARNIKLAKTNILILSSFIERHRWACDWLKPVAGTTAFVRFCSQGDPVDDVELCKRMHEKIGVLMCPGSRCFGSNIDYKGYVRMGYVCETEVLEKGLAELEKFMKSDYKQVPLAQ
ncbi:hypothetical protein MMC25_006312 [Agyrium rufum]|nr:hypothetical protein [Agyrium rufum]